MGGGTGKWRGVGDQWISEIDGDIERLSGFWKKSGDTNERKFVVIVTEDEGYSERIGLGVVVERRGVSIPRLKFTRICS